VGSLGQVGVDVFLAFISLQIFLFYEHVDALLDDRHSGLEARSQLNQHFRDQILMFESLSHLHDPHDGRLDEQLAIFLDVFVRLLLLHLLLRFDGNVDVDAQFLVSVVEVQPQLRVRPERGTAVVGFGLSVHVLEQLALQQNRQNLVEPFGGNLRVFEQLAHAKLIARVELKQDGHLKGGGLQRVQGFGVFRRQLALGLIEKPVELAPAMLGGVKTGKPLKGFFEFERKRE